MQGAPQADGVWVHEAAGDRVLGGGEAGRAWWRALCLNSSRLDSAVETVPTTTAPDTMAPDTMAPETMAPKTMAPETLVPEEIAHSNPKALGLTICMASVRYLRRGGNKCQRGSGLGVCRARRIAQRRVA